jgi:hypothetical protein
MAMDRTAVRNPLKNKGKKSNSGALAQMARINIKAIHTATTEAM